MFDILIVSSSTLLTSNIMCVYQKHLYQEFDDILYEYFMTKIEIWILIAQGIMVNISVVYGIIGKT